ncbi:MAG: hypothetical protein JST00_25570 [Deltaproteobacteria bacterium]|nr:hypothetical protein [Deltaproteobacteria bacterium]
MMTTKMLSAAALLLGTLFAAGCSTELANDAPILDSVDAPMTAVPQGCTYAIPMTILFHDNDHEVVTHVRYRVGTTIDAMVDIPTPNPTRQSAEITLVLPAAAREAAAQHGVQISILDSRGAESHPFPAIVRFN